MEVVREAPAPAKHSLKEVTAALKQFADRLPSTHTEALAPMSGADLLARRPAITGPKGEPIDPTKEYFIAGKGTATNHLKRMLKLYQRHGMPAVVEYLRPYEAFLGTPATEAGKAPAPSRTKKRKAKRITRPAAKI